MDFKRFLLGFVFIVSGSANASTVFMPTDGDVNFFDVNLMGGSILAMFDDDDDGTFVSDLPIPLSSLVTIVPDGFGDYTATNSVNMNSLTLTDNPWYVLAVSTDGGTNWMGDSSASCNAASNSCTVSFADGSALSVDAAIVPVPAAVWLFGTGLIGLVGVARRRS